MTYAENRIIIDVDSHVIELDDFLHKVALENDLPLLPSMESQKELPVIQAGLDRVRELFIKRQQDPQVMAKFESSLLDNTKSGWNRLGPLIPLKEHAHSIYLVLKCSGSYPLFLFTKLLTSTIQLFWRQELER